MKRIVLMFTAMMTLFAAVSCEKASTPTISFSKSYYVMQADAAVDVEIVLSEPAETDISVDLAFKGDAVIDEEYSVSDQKVTIKASESSAKLTITPLNNLADKEIQMSIVGMPTGYIAGEIPTAIVAIEGKEQLIYSFTTKKTDVMETYEIVAKITGVKSGDKFVASEDLKLPVKVTKAEGVKEDAFSIDGDALLLKKGENTAKLKVKAGNVALGSEALVTVSVDAGPRFIKGDISEIQLNFTGVLKISDLLGSWTFKEVYNLEEMELWFMEMEDDPALCPTHNAGFKLTFSANEDGTFKVTPSGGGDWMKFFRDSEISWATPKNVIDGKITGKYCTKENNMFMGALTPAITDFQLTYFKMAKANRSFDNNAEKIGEGMIAMRFNEEGNLEVHLKDYDEPPFGFMWWDPTSKNNFEMFAFASVFEKVK